MPQPNIILIVIDDLPCGDLRCYGSTFHDTPVLDRLAGQESDLRTRTLRVRCVCRGG